MPRTLLALLLLFGAAGWTAEVFATTAINKSFTAATVNPDVVSRLRITLLNTATVALTAAAVTDNLPTQIKIANTPNIADTCGFTGTVAAAGTSVIKLTGGTVPAYLSTDGQCYFEVDVTSASLGNWTNTIPANGPANGFTPGGEVAGYQATESGATVTNADPTSATLGVTAINPPTGAMAFQSSAAYLGDPVELTITLTNPLGNAAITMPLTTFTNNLPSGMVVAPTPAASVDCTTQGSGGVNGTFAPSAGSSTLTMTGGTIGGVANSLAGVCTLKVKVVVTAIGAGLTSQQFTNTVAAGGIGNSYGLGSASFATNKTFATPITLSKSFTPGAVGANQDSVLQIDVSNGSIINPLTITSLTDTLPTGLTVGNPATASINCSASSGVVTNGAFSPALTQGASSITIAGAVAGIDGGVRRCRILVPVRSASYNTYTNTLPANSLVNPNNYPSGTVYAVLQVSPVATFTKSFTSASIRQGESSQLTVNIGNGAGFSLTNAFMTDTLPTSPGQVMVAAAPGAINTCGGTLTANPGSGSISLAGATIPTTGCYFKVNVTGFGIGDHTNTIPANALTSNEGITNLDPASALLVIQTGLQGSKAFSPTTVANGGVSRVILTIQNGSSKIPISGVQVVDGPMTNLTIANPANATTTCAGPTVIEATPGENTATLSGASLPTSGTCLFLFDVLTSGNPTNWPNTIPARGMTTTDGAYNSGSVTRTLLKGTSNIGLNKSFTPATAAGGQPSVLQIDINNPGVQATNASFTDTFPSGMQVYAVPNASTTCTNGVVTATPGGDSVTLSGATLQEGGNCRVTVTVTAIKFGSLTNTIPAGAVSTTELFTNGAATTASLTANQGLGAFKRFTPTSIAAGQNARLTVTLVSSTDTQVLTGIAFTDTLPTGLTVAAIPNATTTCTGGTLTATAGGGQVSLSGATLNPQTTCQVEVDVTAAALGIYVNTIPKSTVTSDQGLKNDANDATATLSAVNAPTVNKSFTPTEVKIGVKSVLTVTVGNNNDQPLTGAALTDTLPSGLTVFTTPNASTTCTGTGVAVAAAAGGTSIALTNATIPANSSCTFQADVVANTPGAYVNSIPAGALTNLEGATNIAAGSATLTVLQPPTVSKSFTPSSIGVNGISQLTITLGNGNASAITLSADLTDTLPGVLKVANPNSLQKTCPGAVTATAGTGTIKYASGASIPAGGCTISVNVTGAQGGSNLNVIAVGALATTSGSNLTAASATLEVQAVAIGNRVWLDNGAGGGIANNGILDGSEAGISGVTVTLYDSGNNLKGATTTDPTGRYYFDNLAPGNYFVKVPASEFASGKPLFNMLSSTGADATQTLDLNDNGIDNATPATNGILTNTFTLATGTMPINEDQTGYPGSLPDNSVNATDDFGFLAQADLAIVKTNPAGSAPPGGTTTYTLVVSNKGPAEVTAAPVTDPAPAKLTFGNWTCAVTTPGSAGGVTTACGAASGSGNLDTTATLQNGGVVTYTVPATLAADASGALVNEAVVSTPAGVVDPVPANNTSSVSINAATYALLDRFRAQGHDDGILVEWTTHGELGTAGFDLARENADGIFEPVHDDLIGSQSAAGEGGHYRYLDAPAPPGLAVRYRLTEVDTHGQRRELGDSPVTALGPVAATSAPAGTATAAPVPTPLVPGQADVTPRPLTAAETSRLAARQAEQRLATPRLAAGAALASPTLDAAARAASTPRLAIAIRETGLYQVSTAALAQAFGWSASKVTGLLQAGQLRLTRNGSDIAWQAAPQGAGLRFYGQATPSNYDPDTVYLLQQGSGIRMASVKLATTGQPGPTSHPSQLRLEDNRFAATVRATDPEADYWFWGMFNTQNDCQDLTKSCRVQEFSLVVPAPAATGTATLALQLRGNSSLAASPDHQVSVTLNGTPIGTGTWDGLTDLRLALPLAASLLRDGANQVRVEAQLPAGAANNYFYLDRFDLDYPGRNLASQDQLVLTGPPGQRLTASGFTSNALQVFDLGDPRRPKTVTGAKIQSGSGGYQVSLVPARATTPYLLVGPGALRAPSSVRRLESTGLAGFTGAPYLIIAPRDFAEEATQPLQRLLALRSSQGLNGRFVPLQALYDEYGAGQKTPHAIRRFLAAAVKTWKIPPAYVLLAGKGTFDPKDYLGHGTDRLPVLLAPTPDAGLIAADQRFVDFNDDGRGDLAIGRLPAATSAEFAGMVDKLVAYEDAGPAPLHQAILVADGPDAAGNHTASSEATAAHLLDAGLRDQDIQRLYLERMTAATARAGLLAGLGRGADLVNYYGHAGVISLDHGLLTASDAAQLPEPGHWPLMLGMTCLVNRFEFPQLLSLGEALLLNPAGGAAAVWSSGGYSYDATATTLNDAVLVALLQQRVPRLGDAIQAGLAAVPATPGTIAGPGIYNLLGDPAMSNLLH